MSFVGSKDTTGAIRSVGRYDPVALLCEGCSTVKFGAHRAVTNVEVVVDSSNAATYTGFIQTASAIRIKSGGDANDAAGGTGARLIRVEGLDENWNVATADLVPLGALASAPSTVTFIRVYRAYVVESGVYGAGLTGANIAAMAIETTGGVLLVSIEAQRGQSETSVYSVPAGFDAYVTSITVSSQPSCDFSMFQRLNADDTAVLAPRRTIEIFPGVGSQHSSLNAARRFPPKTDLWFTATKNSSGTALATANYTVVLEAAT